MPVETTTQPVDQRRGVNQPDGTVPHDNREGSLTRNPVDIMLVFGEGPIKTIRFASELSAKQLRDWGEFRKKRHEKMEPNVRVLGAVGEDDNVSVKLTNIHIKRFRELGISDPHNMTPEESDKLEAERRRIQHIGEFGLARQGRINARAAGLALLKNDAKSVLLSGGRSGAPDFKFFKAEYMRKFKDKAKSLKGQALEDAVTQYRNEQFPSEAELMQDVIIRTFGRAMYDKDIPRQLRKNDFANVFPQANIDKGFADTHSEAKLRSDFAKYEADLSPKAGAGTTTDEPINFIAFVAAKRIEYENILFRKYDKLVYLKYIDEVLKPKIILEEDATNTLDNVILAMEKRPELAGGEVTVGILTADHHVQRATLIAERFGIPVDPDTRVSSHKQLKEHYTSKGRDQTVKIYERMSDPENPAIRPLVVDQTRWSLAMEKPEYIKFWIGWVFKTSRPGTALQMLEPYINSDDQSWAIAINEATSEVGVSLSEFINTARTALASDNLTEFNKLREKAGVLNTDKHRGPVMEELYRQIPRPVAA